MRLFRYPAFLQSDWIIDIATGHTSRQRRHRASPRQQATHSVHDSKRDYQHIDSIAPGYRNLYQLKKISYVHNPLILPRRERGLRSDWPLATFFHRQRQLGAGGVTKTPNRAECRRLICRSLHCDLVPVFSRLGAIRKCTGPWSGLGGIHGPVVRLRVNGVARRGVCLSPIAQQPVISMVQH